MIRKARKRLPRLFGSVASLRKIMVNVWLPRARSAGAECTVGREWSSCLELVDRPETLGFQADMAHTLLYTMGYNAPEDAILPREISIGKTKKNCARL